MKEHLLTLFLAITTGITLFVFTIVNAQPTVPVFSMEEILFEHQTVHGNLVITLDAYEELRLSFLNRVPRGETYAGSTLATTLADTSFLSLPAAGEIPFTTHAVVSTNSNLHEVIVVESGFGIAHRTHAKKTTCADTSVFLVSSFDFTGEDVLIIGLDVDGQAVVEIALP